MTDRYNTDRYNKECPYSPRPSFPASRGLACTLLRSLSAVRENTIFVM